MAKEPMALQEMLATVGKGQNFMVLNLLTQAYNEGFKAGAQQARDGAFKAGYVEGVKKAIAESAAYHAGIVDATDYNVQLMYTCMCVALHEVLGLEADQLMDVSEAFFSLFDKTLHPADLREKLAELGMLQDIYNPFGED